MKSYTDIKQSRKLEEILPIESADMWYWEWPTAPEYNSYEHPMFHKGEGIVNVPCWSLVALLNILPIIEGYGEETPHLFKFGDKWMCKYVGDEDYGMWRVADNPVDACYEMILKLHELKLL